MTDLRVDVCVIGAGPAGSALGQRLARLGHSVVIVEASTFPRPPLGESLVASVLPLLEVLGVGNAVESAGFLRPTATLLRWTDSTEWRRSPSVPGFQVDRGCFDAILLDAARAAGAAVLQPARAISVKHEADGWLTVVQTRERRAVISSRMIADAAGRRGRLGGRKHRPAPRTLALSAYWTGVVVGGPETRVEAGDEQWYWGAPLPDGRFVAAAFVEAAAYRRGVGAFGGRQRFYEHLVMQSELLRPCLRGRCDTNVHVCDASPCHDAEPATADAIKVGEAAFAIDPLSSQGVQTAIGSALHAAAVLHTILERPGSEGLAVEFYRAAQEKAVAFHAYAAAAAYAEAAATRPASFWQTRAASHRATVGVQPNNSPSPLSADSIVQLADSVRLISAPVLSGSVIVSARHVALPGGSGPIAFLDGIELAPLLDMVRQPVTVERLARAWANQMAPDRAATILRWLWSNGALQSAAG